MSETQRHQDAQVVLPHLEIAARSINRATPAFQALLTQFLQDQTDTTGLKIDNLRQAAQGLKHTYELIDGLLKVIDQNKSQPPQEEYVYDPHSPTSPDYGVFRDDL